MSRHYLARQRVARDLETQEETRRVALLKKGAKCNSMPDVYKRAEVTAR